MARFLAAIEGKAGEATRLGSLSSGIRAQAQGWDLGVSVFGRAEGDSDVFSVYMTGGSNGGAQPVYVGSCRLVDGLPEWTPAGIEREDDRLARVEALGVEAGKAAGSWLLDGNSSEDEARSLLQMIEDGDPAFEIPAPLSGEWSDGWAAERVFAEADIEPTDDDEPDLLDAFEAGFAQGFEDEAARSARALIG